MQQLRRDSVAAESGRLLLWRRDWACLPLHRKLKAVQSLPMAVVQLGRSRWVALPLRQMDWRCFVVDQQHWLDQMLALMPGRRPAEMLDRMLTVRKQASVPSVMPGQRRHPVLGQMVDQKLRRHHHPLPTAVRIRSFELVVKAGQTPIHHHQLQRLDRSRAVKACQRRMLGQM